MKRTLQFLSSMRFALILLAVLALACAGGSFITQGMSLNWYINAYGERIGAMIISLGLDDVFHSVWFVALALFLCANLLLCNVVRLPGVIRQYREGFGIGRLVKNEALLASHEQGRFTGSTEDVNGLFSRLRFRNVQQSHTQDNKTVFYSARNTAGVWGAWLCHVGILILIAGFSLGQIKKQEYTFYGVPGQTRPVGDTVYEAEIEDFTIGLRKDDTVEQYTTLLRVRNTESGEEQSGQTSVNAPASLFHMTFFQNSTGWASLVTVLKNDEILQQEILCAGEYLAIADKPDLIVYFLAFYPDYVLDPEQGPMTKSSRMDHPGYLYQVYYLNQVIGMNVLEDDDYVSIDEYTVQFTDPQTYTLIQVKRDPFRGIALAGGLLIAIALFLALYIQPQELWAVEDGKGYRIYGTSKKGGPLFDEYVRDALRETGNTKEGQ